MDLPSLDQLVDEDSLFCSPGPAAMSCLVFVELLSMFYFSLEDAGAKEDGQDQQAASSSAEKTRKQYSSSKLACSYNIS